MVRDFKVRENSEKTLKLCSFKGLQLEALKSHGLYVFSDVLAL